MGSTKENRGIAAVILAAGLGTRMKSDKAKVLHEALGKPLILYVAGTAAAVADNGMIVVVGHQAEKVEAVVSQAFDARYALQEEQLGTGHAVRSALPAVPAHAKHLLILCGDVPLTRKETLRRFIDDHIAEGRDISVLGVRLDDPTGYGRLIFDGTGEITAIVEEADADDEQKAIPDVNTGIYCIDRSIIEEALSAIDADNQQGEYYLTDIIRAGRRRGWKIGATVADDPDEFVGVNTLENLRYVEKILSLKAGKIA